MDDPLVDILINGHYFPHEIVNLAFFSLQVADSLKCLETRIEKMTKLKGFLSIYFKHLETLH